MNERETLTTSELLLCFGKTSEDARWIASADSAAYLNLLVYLVQRGNEGR